MLPRPRCWRARATSRPRASLGGRGGDGIRPDRTRGQPHRVFELAFAAGTTTRSPPCVPPEGLAARCAGRLHGRKPQRPARRLRTHRTKAPDRRNDGQPGTALWRRFWFLSYHAMALSERGARARPGDDRALVAANSKNAHARMVSPTSATRAAPWRTPAASCRPGLPTTRMKPFPWPFQLAYLVVRDPGRQLGERLASVSRRHRARPTQRRAAK